MMWSMVPYASVMFDGDLENIITRRTDSDGQCWGCNTKGEDKEDLSREFASSLTTDRHRFDSLTIQSITSTIDMSRGDQKLYSILRSLQHFDDFHATVKFRSRDFSPETVCETHFWRKVRGW